MTILGAGISLVAGYLLAAYLHSAWMLAAAGIWLSVCRLVPQPNRRCLTLYLLISILAGLYFTGYEFFHRSSLQTLAVDEKVVWVKGELQAPVQRDGDVARMFVLLSAWKENNGNWIDIPGKERVALRVKLDTEIEARQVETWRHGSTFIAPVQLALPATARNPHAFDYKQYLYYQRVHVTAEANYTDIKWTSTGSGIWSFFQSWQAKAANRVDELFGDPKTAGYMKSLLLGVREDVAVEWGEMYSELGLSHILAISGLHVTLVSSMFMWLLERIGINRKHALVTTVLFILGYVMLVGASASAVRSGLMGGVALACQVWNKRLDGREVWAGALIVMLFYDPYQLWNVGFQLSFAITLGLIRFVPYCLYTGSRIPVWLRTLLAVTMTAQVVSFPFFVYHFHLFSPWSWLVNLLATPLLSSLVLPLGYISLLFGTLHPAFAIVPVWLSTRLLEWVHIPLFALENMQVPFTHWPHPEWWWLIAYGIFLLSLPKLWDLGYHRRRDMILYFIVLIGLVVAARQPFYGHDEVRITYLDVGQGDSIIVEVGQKKVYLMDAGGKNTWEIRETWRKKRDPYEVGKDVVLPFLRSRGITHVDRVVLTHGDMDHIGGMDALLGKMTFGAVLTNGKSPKAKEIELLVRFQAQSVPVWSGEPGMKWTDMPGVEWKWLHPKQSTGYSSNDASVVLQLTAYGKTVLFTGDIEADGENMLLENGIPVIDVLKVAHHGSKTSSTEAFLTATSPRYAVISAGQRNRYGHPSPEVLERFTKIGTHLFRTDQHGAVTLTISSKGISWKTQLADT